MSSLRQEVQQLETEGLQKIKLAVAGLEAEGLHRLLRGTICLSPCPWPHPHPKNAAMLQLPPFLSCPLRSLNELHLVSAPVVEEVELALEAPSSAVSEAQEVAIPTHMSPLCLQLGASRGFTNARLRGAVRHHQPHGVLSVHMLTGIIWGEVGMSLLHQDLPKLRCPQAS